MKKLFITLCCTLIIATVFFVNINIVNASNQLHYNENQIYYKGVTNIYNVEINVNNEISVVTDGFSSSLYGTYDDNVSKLPYGVYTNMQPQASNFSNSVTYHSLVSNYSLGLVSNVDGEYSSLSNPSYDIRRVSYSLKSVTNYVLEDVFYTFNYNDVIISNNYRDLVSSFFNEDTVFAFFVNVFDSSGNITWSGNIFNVETTLTFDLYDVNRSSESISYSIPANLTTLQGVNVFYFDISDISDMTYYYIMNPKLIVHYTDPLEDGEYVNVTFLDVIAAHSVFNDNPPILDLVPSLLMYKGFDNSLEFLQFYKQVNIDSIDFDIDFTSWITNSVTSFLDTDILGVFSISDILMFILALGLTIMMIKFFMGG